ncbi:MAG: hypothetical protein QF416_07585 [Candidatus Marinimicrobia bacterium]|nr:hypothetical protein [Candidatus Neomarinimicrobiota bacterium]MDP7060313.1 hypothetical protein [Candidatus Neomarinimicrobiota bacterium]|tara:strand:- start:2274 stop:2543 length:270 start_codon:yes stop_codon:yes gene_type:complete
MKRLTIITVVMLFFFITPKILSACAVCYGAPADHPMTESLNLAIIALIGVTGTVLSGIATFFIFLVRREKKVDDVTNMYDSENGNGKFN